MAIRKPATYIGDDLHVRAAVHEVEHLLSIRKPCVNASISFPVHKWNNMLAEVVRAT